MLKKITAISSLGLLIVSCSSGDKNMQISSIKEGDKNLSCKDLLLEMNDARFKGSLAEKTKGVKISNVIKPINYVSDYLSSNKTISAAEGRVSYLNGIYNILKCDEKKDMLEEEVVQDKKDEKEYSSTKPVRYNPEDSRSFRYYQDGDYEVYKPKNYGYDNRGHQPYDRPYYYNEGYRMSNNYQDSYYSDPYNRGHHYKKPENNYYRPATQDYRISKPPMSNYSSYGFTYQPDYAYSVPRYYK